MIKGDITNEPGDTVVVPSAFVLSDKANQDAVAYRVASAGY
jgi:hypothetical protein